MVDFSSKYYKIRPTKDRGYDPATKDKFNRRQKKNSVFDHAVGDIVLQENNKLITGAEAHENIYSEIYENDLYQIDNMSLDEKK